MRPSPPRTSRAFTIIELLVAIAIMVTVAATTLSIVSVLARSNRIEGGVDTVQVSVTAVRAYAGRPHQRFVGMVDPSDPAMTASYNHAFAGVAIIFTQTGEARLVENVVGAAAASTGVPLEKPVLNPDGTIKTYPRNGYADIAQREYIRLPKGTGLLGIVADTTSKPTAQLALVAPPFALRFDTYGAMIYGNPQDDASWVYYDGNYDNKFEDGANAGRPNGYDPGAVAPTLDATKTRYQLPFERIDTVLGILVYSQIDFAAAKDSTGTPLNLSLGADGSTGPGHVNKTARDWFTAPGHSRVMFFSRYTGAVIR